MHASFRNRRCNRRMLGDKYIGTRASKRELCFHSCSPTFCVICVFLNGYTVHCVRENDFRKRRRRDSPRCNCVARKFDIDVVIIIVVVAGAAIFAAAAQSDCTKERNCIAHCVFYSTLPPARIFTLCSSVATAKLLHEFSIYIYIYI